MKYDIIAEAHEGVFSVPEEVFAQVEADSEEEALLEYCKINKKAIYQEHWKCFMYGIRKLHAKPINNITL